MRKSIDIKLTDEYKERFMKVIDDTINKVIERERASLTPQEIRSIKNLAIDQVNVNVTARSKMKSMWVFDTADYLTILVEQNKKDKGNNKNYAMKPNLTWVYGSKHKDGMSRKEFESRALEMLLEDAETAAFYGALSYITEE